MIALQTASLLPDKVSSDVAKRRPMTTASVVQRGSESTVGSAVQSGGSIIQAYTSVTSMARIFSVMAVAAYL